MSCAYRFPPAPRCDDLKYLGVTPCLFLDRSRPGPAPEVFPAYLYKDAASELIVVAEDRFENVIEKLIERGAFVPKGGAE